MRERRTTGKGVVVGRGEGGKGRGLCINQCFWRVENIGDTTGHILGVFTKTCC